VHQFRGQRGETGPSVGRTKVCFTRGKEVSSGRGGLRAGGLRNNFNGGGFGFETQPVSTSAGNPINKGGGRCGVEGFGGGGEIGEAPTDPSGAGNWEKGT